MISRIVKRLSAAGANTVGTAVFFLFSFGFIGWWVNPALQYHYRMPIFLLGKPFLAGFWDKPGGWLEYGARFLAQFSQIPWAGALIATAILFAIYLATGRLLGMAGQSTSRFPARERVLQQPEKRADIQSTATLKEKPVDKKVFTSERGGGDSARGAMVDLVPSGLLFLLAIRYDYPWLETSTGLLAALGAAVAYFTLPLRNPWLRLACFYLLAGVLIYAAGIVPAVLFVWLGGLLEWVARRRWVLGAAGLVSGMLLAAWFANWAAVRPAELMLPWGDGWKLTMAAYLFYPFAILLLGAWGGRAARAPAPLAKDKPVRKQRLSFRERMRVLGRSDRLYRGIRWCWLLAAMVVAFRTFDDNRKALIQVDYYAGREQWDEVLQAASRLERYNASSRLNINRALYHRGQLLDSLFCYRQSREFGLLPGPERGIEICRALSATWLELGQVNVAEHWAHEALEQEGDRPDILMLLAKINIVKEKYQAARTFLGLLRRNPFHRRWADDYLRRLDGDPKLAEDAELARLRSLRVTTDQPGGSPPALLLLQLLQANPRNRMAFEYLMAHYLLSMKPENIVPHLDRLAAYNIPELPRHLQEALLAYQRHVLLESKQTVNLRGRTIHPEIQRRFERFLEILTSFQGNAEAARAIMARELGDTYWYYSLYEETFRKRTSAPEVNP